MHLSSDNGSPPSKTPLANFGVAETLGSVLILAVLIARINVV